MKIWCFLVLQRNQKYSLFRPISWTIAGGFRVSYRFEMWRFEVPVHVDEEAKGFGERFSMSNVNIQFVFCKKLLEFVFL